MNIDITHTGRNISPRQKTADADRTDANDHLAIDMEMYFLAVTPILYQT